MAALRLLAPGRPGRPVGPRLTWRRRLPSSTRRRAGTGHGPVDEEAREAPDDEGRGPRGGREPHDRLARGLGRARGIAGHRGPSRAGRTAVGLPAQRQRPQPAAEEPPHVHHRARRRRPGQPVLRAHGPLRRGRGPPARLPRPGRQHQRRTRQGTRGHSRLHRPPGGRPHPGARPTGVTASSSSRWRAAPVSSASTGPPRGWPSTP